MVNAITILLTRSLLSSSMWALALTRWASELMQLTEVENLGAQRGERKTGTKEKAVAGPLISVAKLLGCSQPFLWNHTQEVFILCISVRSIRKLGKLVMSPVPKSCYRICQPEIQEIST